MEEVEEVQEAEAQQAGARGMEELPEEVLEFILSLLPPYRELRRAAAVCRRWHRVSLDVMRKTSNKLVKAIGEFKIQWKNITPVDMAPTITKRFSHAACVHENSMYIFGGCTTNSTAFNDLWRFDLSNRLWIRPLAMGTYPVPKAYTSMVRYKDNLVLFGGWTYPSPSPYYQHLTMYNEIHFYNVTSNRWILVNATNSPPQMAGHSAAVLGDQMIVFGGLSRRDSGLLCSNNIWVLNLISMCWHKQVTSEPRPPARYSQSLIIIDDDNVMILGGVQTPHNRFAYNDCWMLNMTGAVWTWREIAVKNKEWAAANIWCNPACRVGDKVVSLSRSRNGRWNGGKPLVTSAVRITTSNQPGEVAARVEQCARRPLDKDQNINGRRGSLPQRQNINQRQETTSNEPKAGPSQEGERQNDGLSRELERRNEGPSRGEERQNRGPSREGERLNEGPSREGESHNEGSSGEDCGFRPPQDVNRPGSSNQLLRKIPEAKDGRLDNRLSKKDVSRQRALQMGKPSGMKIVRQLQEANKYKMAAFACDNAIHNSPPENDLINQRQIAHLDHRQNEAEQPQLVEPAPQPAVKKQKRNTLTMHVLDISTVLDGEHHVSWLCPKVGEASGAPEELVMYSLVRGNGELIMFGGVHNDINILNTFSRSQQYLYSNSLHFITAPRDVI